MTVGRFARSAAAALLGSAALGTLPGCTQPGPLASRRSTVGSLKASVSQLEYSNDNLKKQVADLKSESTRLENELVLEREGNGELTARLDDAKYALRQQGQDVTAFGRTSRASRSASTAADQDTPPARASAAAGDDDIPQPRRSGSSARTSRTARKPPSTQIPRIEPSLDNGPGALELPVDPGPQASRFVDDGRWLPVARGPARGGSVEVR